MLLDESGNFHQKHDRGSAAPNKIGLNQHLLALELKKLSSAPLPLPT